ncbi:MAG: glutamate--tRNA ligase [Ruthenibacterium sp.]
MTQPIITRFAPSPTGFMHIGNLRTALYAYLLARSTGGKFIVRIEDTDQVRIVEGATEVILQTLATTGLTYDEGPVIGGPNGPYVQSERRDIYRDYAQRLIASGSAYYCFCTKERLEALHEDAAAGGYDRHCRDLPQSEIDKMLASGAPYVVRQKIPLAGTTAYTDEVFGEISVENKELQDQILMKADGLPTYNFAHVVDDHLMGVTHVVRGSEYLTSTPKYVLLYDAFGWQRPHYVHLPLLMGRGADGTVSKLSKRHGAVSFQDLVGAGYLPEAILNYIALLGWCPKDSTQEFFTLEELTHAFSLAGVSKSPAVFDYDKLLWFNAEYIKGMTEAAFCEKALPLLCAAWPGCPPAQREGLCALLHSRVSVFSEIPAKIEFLTKRLPCPADTYENKKNKTTPASCLAVLRGVRPLLDAAAWDNDALFALLKQYAQDSGVKSGAVMLAVRVAVARMAVTPGGATELMEVLGKEESLARIDLVIAELTAAQ